MKCQQQTGPESLVMAYRTYIRRRKNRGRQEWIARLICKDEVTGIDREFNKGGLQLLRLEVTLLLPKTSLVAKI